MNSGSCSQMSSSRKWPIDSKTTAAQLQWSLNNSCHRTTEETPHPTFCWQALILGFQTKEVSILLSFYFHVVLQHLKTFIQTNCRFKRVLRFATLDAWIFRLLRDAAFSWRPEKLLCRLKALPIFLTSCISQNKDHFNLFGFFRGCIHAGRKNQRQIRFLLLSGRHIWAPKWQQHCVSIQSFVNLGKTFSRISRIWNM